MPIRLSGLISGMDTDALVQELVSAYSTKKDKYVKEQTKLGWKMESWKSLNTKVYSFYTNSLSNMRFSANYNKKTVSVSNSTKANITATADAVVGDQTLSVNKLATTGYLTGAKLGSYTDAEGKTQNVKTSTKLSELNGSIGSGIVNVKVDGKESNIEISGDMTVAQMIVQFKNAGLNASFDETNQRMFISSKKSGEENDFSLTGNAAGIEALKAIGVYAVSAQDIEQYKTQAAYTDEELENMALNRYLKTQISAANKTYTDKNSELSTENTELNKELTYAKLTSENKAKKYVEVQNNIKKLETEIAKLEADTEKDNTEAIEKKRKQIDANNETLTLYDKVNQKYGIEITGTAVEEAGFNKVSEPSDDEIKEYLDGINAKITDNKQIIKANDDAVTANNKLLEKTYTTDEIKSLEFTTYGTDDKSTIPADYTSDSTYTDILNQYEALRTSARDVMNAVNGATVGGKVDMEALSAALGGSGAVRISGQDSEIVLNGAVFTSNSNNYSINGLTITAMGVTEPGEEVTVTTSMDVDGMYDMIKGFLTSYNELIKEMDSLYNADSAKGYEPLTDDEKEAMSEKEIEKWETKIKDSLLRRDSTLSGVISAMKMAMSGSFTVDGERLTLSSFGISTLGYFASGENEKGVYHIDGDSEDASTAGNADKLKKLIANDPDKVMDFFSQLTTSLYNTLTKKMAGSSISSAYTIYNDKELQKRYDDYDDTIEKWEDKLEDIEEKYYDQFSKMETAMAEMQSSTSALSSLMGS